VNGKGKTYDFVDEERFDAIHVEIDVVGPDPPAGNVVARDEEARKVGEQREHQRRQRVGQRDVGRRQADGVDDRDGEEVGEEVDGEEDPEATGVVLQPRDEVHRHPA
jgi:hypothetical protein